MNALTRIDTRIIQPEEAEPVAMDTPLYGVVAAIALWLMLHVGLAISWLTAGSV
jgi:hypothetical protein